MRFSKSFRIFSFSLLAVVTLIVVTSVLLSLFYEKAVVRYMKKYFDEHLLTELSMKDIRFSVLKGFPNATVKITDVVLLSGEDFSAEDFTGTFADTLLQARTVSFQFDLMKLFNKQYELKKIEVSQGKLNVLFDKKNRHNLNIWKKGTSTADYAVNLKSLMFNSSRLHVMAAKSGFNLAAFSRRTGFRGNYSGSILSGETRGNLNLDSLTFKGNTLARDASLNLTVKMVYGGQRIRISQGRIHLNKAVASISGEYVGGKENTIDLTVGMPGFGLPELMSVLPFTGKLLPPSVNFSGDGKLTAVIKGSLSGRNDLFIRSNFELTDCSARNPKTGTTIDQITLAGSASGTTRENFKLELNSVSFALGRGQINGTFILQNLQSLLFQAELHATVDLAALQEFAGIDTFENLNGFIRSDFNASGSLKKMAGSAATALEFLENGSFVFDQVDIKVRKQPWDFKAVSGKAFWDNTLRLDSLAMKVNGTEFLISGSLQNLPEYLLKKGKLKSNVEITTDNFDIDNMLKNYPKRSSTGRSAGTSLFLPGIQLRAHLKAGNFVAGKFNARDLSLHLSAIKDSIYVNDFSMKFPDGSITGSALLTRNPAGTLSITCNSQPQLINIQQLFTAFNNFTQHFIIDKNVRGLLTGTVSFYAQWDSALKFIPRSIKAEADIAIANGELVQFEPMLALSKYIDVEELRHIRFKTMNNVFYISNSLVTIPEMAIHSSAFNIFVSGQHTFDNVFDYRMRVLLSEVLFNKARKKKQEINEFMVEETPGDRTTIPLIIAGTPDNFDVSFDRKRAFSLTRNNIKTGAQTGEIKPASSNFRIEWEESDREAEVDKPVSGSSSSDFVIEWEEDSADEE